MLTVETRKMSSGLEVPSLKDEARRAIPDVAFGVDHISHTAALKPANPEESQYLNVRIKEGDAYTVELSRSGYKICGNGFESAPPDGCDGKTFETLHQLLDHISPSYRDAFGTTLSAKLSLLSQQRLASNDDDE